MSIQAQVLDPLADLQARLGIAYVFISHHLGVIRFPRTRTRRHTTLLAAVPRLDSTALRPREAHHARS